MDDEPTRPETAGAVTAVGHRGIRAAKLRPAMHEQLRSVHFPLVDFVRLG
jgi:hypothetical protein